MTTRGVSFVGGGGRCALIAAIDTGSHGAGHALHGGQGGQRIRTSSHSCCLGMQLLRALLTLRFWAGKG